MGSAYPKSRSPKPAASSQVRDLLWHVSGLPDYLESGMYVAVDQVSPEYVNNLLPAWSREARPGEKHTYCNTNYFVLSRVIAAVSGLSFAEFIDSNLITPFGLRSTFVLGGESDAPQIANGYRNTGYGLPLVEPSNDFNLETVGDGGVLSSLNDLIRWQALLWNGEIVQRTSTEDDADPRRTGLRGEL